MSTEISKTYDPAQSEDKWYKYWLDNKFFTAKADPLKEPYTIVIPPPNVTGVLHMGHMLNNTIQDILIRRARMQGKEACWVAGTDHASIATEAKVVAMLNEKGIDKKNLSRDEFLNHAWDWKNKYGGIILEQLKKLGCSCDWDRTRFTMEESLSEAVIKVFVDLYNKGHIYRGVRMVNWDPKGKTALSDEEVIHKEIPSKLYYIKYKVVGENDFITVATTRPETIMADMAICVNPDDERYFHLHGKKVIVPLINREIPVITDDYVTADFGTGCLKITPAHDINDYEIGLKHKLEVLDILADDGKLNEKAQILIGEDRFIARKKITKMLEEVGLLEKVEDYKSNVGYSERNPDTVIEPRISMQWWMKMKHLSKPALDNVMNDEILFHPSKFKNMYRSWMENVKDWCISRQLWWGQQIPAYYLPNGEFIVAENIEMALELAKEKLKNNSLTIFDLKQDEDVVDTWFSSWLWPISVFDGFKDPNNKDIKYFYPTDTLVTAPEIIFFWVARMIMAGYEYRNEKPFKNVYFTGIVRDKQGRKMSKSLGNSPDPIDLMKIYGADGVRSGMLFSSQAGNDLMFDEKLCEQGRNFSNKIWNAFRLIKGWETIDSEEISKEERDSNQLSFEWFESKFNQSLNEIDEHFSKFRISDALLSLYNLVWGDFCAWYLEMVKPEFGKPIEVQAYNQTVELFEKLMKVLHPFMPFITEEIWHQLKQRGENATICKEIYPEADKFNLEIIEQGNIYQEIVSQIRNIRSGRGLSPKISLPLFIKSNQIDIYKKFDFLIKKSANVSEINFVTEKVPNALSFLIKAEEYFIKLNEEINIEEEIEKIKKELEYQNGFKNSVLKKLENEKFVTNAKPEVIEIERKKLTDANSKIKALEEQLLGLRK